MYVDLQSNYWAAYTHAKNGDHANLQKEIASFDNPVAVLNSVYGGTPTTMLHTAVYNGHAKCVELLLNLKASPTVYNSYGQTAIQEARSKGQKDIMDLLDNWGNAPASLAPPIAPPVHSAYLQPPPVSSGMPVTVPCVSDECEYETSIPHLPAQNPGAIGFHPPAANMATQPPVRGASVICVT